MSEVKWIKIVVDIFDDEKVLLIESMPDADKIIVIWFKLLCLAGKTNNGGVLMLNERIHYTDEMLATIFRRPVNTVRMALKVFEDFGMIEVVNDVITIPNWSKHQTLDQLEERKKYMRKYMQKYREKQKKLASGECKANSKVYSKVNVSDPEVEVEEELDIDKEEDINTPPAPYEEIKDLYNSICVSLPQIKTVSNNRKQHLKARWKQFDYSLTTFEEVFRKVEASEFCKGKNERGWKADFDWLIKNDHNMTKVLEGKYDNDKWRVIDGTVNANSRNSSWRERNADVFNDPIFRKSKFRKSG